MSSSESECNTSHIAGVKTGKKREVKERKGMSQLGPKYGRTEIWLRKRKVEMDREKN
jgi:hypothetical protein